MEKVSKRSRRREQVSDYIPTTDDVRDAYSSESGDSTYANRMFDAWLARYKAKVVAKTEERIIKLLEANFYRFDLSNNWVDSPMGLDEFLALIKASQKDHETVSLLTKGENNG